MSDYGAIVGKMFVPTFESNIDHFKVRGFDPGRNMVLTIAYPKTGNQFEDEIDAKVLLNALQIGEYKAYGGSQEEFLQSALPLYARYLDILPHQTPKEVVFDGILCRRCSHRFGNMFDFCQKHWVDEKCYRFKLD